MLAQMGLFLKRVGKKLAKGKDLDEETDLFTGIAEIEWSMRANLSAALAKGDKVGLPGLPDPVQPEPAKADEEVAKGNATGKKSKTKEAKDICE